MKKGKWCLVLKENKELFIMRVVQTITNQISKKYKEVDAQFANFFFYTL